MSNGGTRFVLGYHPLLLLQLYCCRVPMCIVIATFLHAVLVLECSLHRDLQGLDANRTVASQDRKWFRAFEYIYIYVYIYIYICIDSAIYIYIYNNYVLYV